MKLPLIPEDKANHFVYGFLIYIVSSLLVTPEKAFAIVWLFALGKEIRDEVVYGGFDIFDALVTVIPGTILLYLENFK